MKKTQAHRDKEEELLFIWLSTLPQPYAEQMRALYKEMAALDTEEAKLYKALDGMEAVIQHNFSDISTWEPHEYNLNLTHANDKVAFSPYLSQLRQEIREDTRDKIAASQKG
ncbi:5'-deoxynucleotidase YfbR-like HD superfamily hydrolase [Streptococcus rupicaprae]|uniref:5'-deoxynucleotidase YfbR-like HD superfamily hydrolase n=1 Tax=Streptococcus rupicaprae TaxID=759619 RepID=A0ABV2FKX4_9STRE